MVRVIDVCVSDDTLKVEFDDGRTISVPQTGIRACCMVHLQSVPIGD
jgi:hypothetical protein